MRTTGEAAAAAQAVPPGAPPAGPPAAPPAAAPGTVYGYEVRGTVPAPRPMPGLEPAQTAQGPARAAAARNSASGAGASAGASAGAEIGAGAGARSGSGSGPAAPAASGQPGFGGGSFARGYAAPADAVRCAMLGSPPTFWFNGDAGRLTISVESGRLVADGVMHIGEDLAQLVAAVLLNHDGEAADAVEPVRAALAELATLAGHGEIEVTVDLSGASPRLGWISRFDPAPWVTWHDWWSAFAASPAARTAAAAGSAGGGDEVDDCFRRQGLRVVRCADPGCAAPLTDRHPAWPGVWSAASGALGPVCTAAAAAKAWPAGLLSAVPHTIAEE
ncbi:MAG TPA: hypothetical protein VH372_15780 [Actinospica sp.]|nr:hypothetical protein [Actinospica sp.]